MRKYIYTLLCLLTSTWLWAEEPNCPKDTIDGEEVYKYEVEKSIGLYRIGINFNVPQSEIIRLNPQLRERPLHYGETIFIPTGKKAERVKEAAVEKKTTDSATVAAADSIAVNRISVDSTVVDSIVADSIVTDSIVTPRRTIELALMLPFESQQTKKSVNAERMMEFYQGVLLALHNRQSDSILYRLRVFDTERSERRVAALCDSTILDSVRGIIGLAYPIQIERMAMWCDEHQVPLLLPFTDEADLSSHPQLLQFNSTNTQEADSLCQWIQKHDVHCAAIEVREADLTEPIRVLRKQMKANGIAYTALAIRDLTNDSVEYALDKEKENLIILHSDRYQHVRILIPHLERLQQAGYNIRIVSQYSWLKENLSLPQVYTSVFNTIANEEYDALWQKYFMNDHVSKAPRYDILGYDLMNTMLDWLNGEKEHNGLQSTVTWQQTGQAGWQNTRVEVKTEK